MAINLLVDLANKKAINALTDPNPAIPPNLVAQGNYDFNAYYLDVGSPYTYHRFPTASNEMNLRQNGPPTDGTFSLSFIGFTSAPIDINVSLSDLQSTAEAITSIGKGNVHVDGNKRDGWTFEFIGLRAGLAQPPLTANTSGTLEPSEAIIDPFQVGGLGGQNAIQRVRIRQRPVASTTNFRELTAGSAWGWTTVGGSPLNTSGVSPSFWIAPVYDIILELKLFINGARSGSDGVATLIAGRSGADGVVVDDGRGRTGADGVVAGSGGRTIMPLNVFNVISGNSYTGAFGAHSLVVESIDNVFSSADIGALISNMYGEQYCIASVAAGSSGVNAASFTGSQTLFTTATIPTGTPSSGKIRIALNSTTSVILSYSGISGKNFLNCALIAGSGVLSTSWCISVADSSYLAGFGAATIVGIGNFGANVNNVLHLDGSFSGSANLHFFQFDILPTVAKTLQSASANFTAADIGHGLTGPDFVDGTTIVSVQSSTSVTLSVFPTAAGTGLSWTIVAQITTTYQSASAAFSASDIGLVMTGQFIPAGTVITSVTDATHAVLSNAPTNTGTALSWAIASQVSRTYQSATAAFAGGDIGKLIDGDNIPPNTTIVSVTDATHAVLSVAPTAAGTALNWQIVSNTSAAPTVTDLVVGDSVTNAKQRIAFAQPPAFGTFTIKSGAGGAQPLATSEAPLDAPSIQAALNATYPALGQFLVGVVSPTTVDVTFGVVGAQNHLVVDDTNTVYDHQALTIVLVTGVGESGIVGVHGFPNIIDGTIAYFGNVRVATPCGEELFEHLSDGTGAVRYRQRFTILKRFFSPQGLNTPGPHGSYLVTEDSMEDRNGMLLWDRVWVTLPAGRTEFHQQQRACYGVPKTYSGTTLVDIQLFSVSISTWTRVQISYTLGHPGASGIPQDGPAATVVHFINGQTVLIPFNGFSVAVGTFGGQYVQSWSRRRWLGNIWEQSVFIN